MPDHAHALPVRADEAAARETLLCLLARGPDSPATLEAAWREFHESYAHKIRKYAFSCGAAEQDVADCVQEVWTELLLRLPKFRLDPKRGQFDTWLFHIVRGKTANQRRLSKRHLLQENPDTLQTVPDNHSSPDRAAEQAELFALACAELKERLSSCNYRILQMRLLEDRPVAEVAEALGLSHEQVWYRYHRARREMEQIGAAWSSGLGVQMNLDDEEKEKGKKSAQGNPHKLVSRSIHATAHLRQGGTCVDYVFQRLELGRRELTPEWKVEWNCDEGVPKPVLYIRKLALVAYAEICGPEEFIRDNWPRIANAALAAGVAAGIATIIATPSAALPVFQMEFLKRLHLKGEPPTQERVVVSLSTRQEPNGPWRTCKD